MSKSTVDSPLPTASLSGTLILGAQAIIEQHVSEDYQAAMLGIASTVVTFSAMRITKWIQAAIHYRDVKKAKDGTLSLIDTAIAELEAELDTAAEQSFIDEVKADIASLKRQRVAVIKNQVQILNLEAYVGEHPMKSAEVESTRTTDFI